MAGKFDAQQWVTDRIVAAIEAGTPPWRQPWTGTARGAVFPYRACGEAYRGINVILLWLEAWEKGYASRFWFTYRQAQALGGQVRKGEKSASVIKFGTFEKAGTAEEDDRRAIPFTKLYAVFNADQIDGLPEVYHRHPEAPRDLGTEPDRALEAFFAATGAVIVSSSDPRAYYDFKADRIHMPPIRTFHAMAGYYATLAHEATHWTGHASRLDRLAKFADRDAYAFEELVAELGNVMLCARLGLTPDFGQSAAYVESWLSALRNDKRLIFRAAAEAQKAVDFLLEAGGGVAQRSAA
ncbi:ArdC family protein [Amaricoccus sp. W119]|uniref:ArdC family protein n=1 Tax=Amaricoccus sp. W119 TaxID=3391833 RepID=UPI0039A49DE5